MTTECAGFWHGVRSSEMPMRPWWIYALRIAIFLTAVAGFAKGDPIYGVFCLLGLGLALVPAFLARSPNAAVPFEVEVVLLFLMLMDMTLGNMLGFYVRMPWYDKALHLGNSMLVGGIAFFAVYVAHATHRMQFKPWSDGVAILLLTLGLGAVWEIGEYAADQLVGARSQGSPGMSPLADTMADLMLDGLGGLLAAVIGPLYIRYSARSRRRVAELTHLLSQRERALPAR